MFDRFEKLIGNDNLDRIKKKVVMVIGVGGVGGYVVEGLVRSGISNIILIDSDKVDITNKNRQIIALNSTIGKKKVEVMRNRILDINENSTVEVLDVFLDENNTEEIINKYNPDYIVDACDTITTKKKIIASCLKYNIKFISCMGTGNKLDPTRFEVTDIYKTSG